jgi:hypothetical protein
VAGAAPAAVPPIAPPPPVQTPLQQRPGDTGTEQVNPAIAPQGMLAPLPSQRPAFVPFQAGAIPNGNVSY